MNAKALTLALAAVALCSSAANAESCYKYSVNGANVLTSPAVVTDSVVTMPAVIDGSSITSCAPLFGKRTHMDHDMELGRSRGIASGLLGGLPLVGGLFGTRDRVQTFSAVIPGSVSTATRICGQEKANEMFSLRLFGFGLGAGKVDPDWDKRRLGNPL